MVDATGCEDYNILHSNGATAGQVCSFGSWATNHHSPHISITHTYRERERVGEGRIGNTREPNKLTTLLMYSPVNPRTCLPYAHHAQSVSHASYQMIPKPSKEEGLIVGWPAGKADMDALKALAGEITAAI